MNYYKMKGMGLGRIGGWEKLECSILANSPIEASEQFDKIFKSQDSTRKLTSLTEIENTHWLGGLEPE